MSKINIENYELYMKSRPHVVILGAGASCAAIPRGDKNGRYSSAMNEFIEKLGLTGFLANVKEKKQGFPTWFSIRSGIPVPLIS